MTTVNYRMVSFDLSETVIKILWSDSQLTTFHYVWLRDNCSCLKCGNHVSGSRLQSILDIPLDIRPASVHLNSDHLLIEWANDGHTSQFPVIWLRNHIYSRDERSRVKPQAIHWNGSKMTIPRVNYLKVLDNVDERWRLFSNVRESGIVLVEEVGLDPSEFERLGGVLGYIRETHYGRVFDLKVAASAASGATCPSLLLPHTDEVYRNVPTGINIFHCLEHSCDGGGETILVDGFYVSDILRKEDPNAFALLSRLPIRHERVASGQRIISKHPVFVLDAEGLVAEVRLNERTMSALDVPPQDMLPVYAAIRKALQIAYDRAIQMYCGLTAGQALIFDNLRVLHGRTQFAGSRHLRHAHVFRDEFYAKCAGLESIRRTPYPV